MSQLLRLLNNARIEHRTKGVNVGREFVNISCPMCGEQRFHCGIHETDLWYKCWVCGQGGQWYKIRKVLEKRYPNVPWNELKPKSKNTKSYVDEVAGAKKGKHQKILQNWRELNEEDYQLIDWITEMPADLDSSYRKRAVPLEHALDMGLKAGVNKLFGYAVFCLDEVLVARKFNRRSEGSKWWKSTESKYNIFGSSWVKKSSPSIGVITEGIFDCLRIPLGIGVSILGSAFSEDLIFDISESFASADELVLALDRDVHEKSLVNFALTLTDLGFSVRVPDWSQVDDRIKDLDELYLIDGEKAVLEFLSLPLQTEISFVC